MYFNYHLFLSRFIVTPVTGLYFRVIITGASARNLERDPVTGLHFWVTITSVSNDKVRHLPVTGLHFWVTITLWRIIT